MLLDPEYTCNAEETDTMLWLHASKTNCKTILILSPDTDVYMIGLPLNCMQDKNIIVQISTFNSREVKVLYMNRMRSALSSDPDLANITRISLSMILQTLFVVTGCDYISFFSGIGKATFLRSFFQHAEFITGATQYTKGSLADTELNDDTHKLGFLAFMRLIGVVYFKKYATAFELDTPESYFKSFISSTTDAEKQHKVWLEELRTSIWPRITYEDDILPTTEALWRHWLRSCWVITMWKQSDRNIMQVADITRCGWKINNGIVSIDWDSDSNLAAINEKVILLTKGCKCKKGCNSSRCSCRKKQQNCTEGCECLHCSNLPSNSEKNIEVDPVTEIEFDHEEDTDLIESITELAEESEDDYDTQEEAGFEELDDTNDVDDLLSD